MAEEPTPIHIETANEVKWRRFITSKDPKTKAKYEKQVHTFLQYCEPTVDRVDRLPYNTETLESFFQDLHDAGFSTSTLWSTFTPIKAYFLRMLGIDVDGKHTDLPVMFSQWEKNDLTKQSEVFTKEEAARFLMEADDSTFLQAKVALILGTHGALRKCEIVALLVGKLEMYPTHCIGRVMRKKNKGPLREDCFFIEDPACLAVLRRYEQKFAHNTDPTKRYLRRIGVNGKGTTANVGINTIGDYPEKIAIWLEKPNSNKYSSHCFRRTAATWAADGGCSVLQLKNLGGWRSEKVPSAILRSPLPQSPPVAIFPEGAKESNTGGGTDTTKSVSFTTSQTVKRPAPADENDPPGKVVAPNTYVQNITYTIDMSNASNISNFSFVVPNLK